MGDFRHLNGIVEEIKERLGKNVVSVVLCGSGSTDELCWMKKGDHEEYLSDIDIMVITRRYNPLYHRRLNSIEKSSDFPVSIDFLPAYRLKYHKDLMSYKMKFSGKVLFGDLEVLEDIPTKSASELSYWEGLRLLFNSGVQLLNTSLNEIGVKRTFYCLKSVEACIESALIFEKEHEIKYRNRIKKFSKTRFSFNFPKDKILKISNLRFSHEPDDWKYSDELWSFCREIVLNMLSFHLSRYLKVEGPIEEKLDFMVRTKRKPFKSDLISWVKMLSIKKILLNPFYMHSYSLDNLRQGTLLLKNRHSKSSSMREKNLLFWNNLINYMGA